MKGKTTFINAQACISASGDLEMLAKDYFSGRVPLQKTNWSTNSKSVDVLIGQIPESILGPLSEAWKSPFLARCKAGVRALFADLSLRLSDKSFDAVLIGRGRFKTFNPAFSVEEMQAHMSSAQWERWILDIFAESGFTFRGEEQIAIVETSCITGITEMSMAQQRIRQGKWKRALLIAFDPISPGGFYLMDALGVISRGLTSDFPKVFHTDRDGFSRSEAFCATVVSDTHELGSEPPVVIREISLSNDSSGLTAMNPEGGGLKFCIQDCLSRSGVLAEEISFVKSHGTGTKMNDRVESSVICEVLDGKLSNAPVVSYKSQFGHCTNANGLFELALATASMRKNVLMPVPNSLPQDPALHAAVVHEKQDGKNLKFCLGIGMGFGGLNGVYLLEKVTA